MNCAGIDSDLRIYLIRKQFLCFIQKATLSFALIIKFLKLVLKCKSHIPTTAHIGKVGPGVATSTCLFRTGQREQFDEYLDGIYY